MLCELPPYNKSFATASIIKPISLLQVTWLYWKSLQDEDINAIVSSCINVLLFIKTVCAFMISAFVLATEPVDTNLGYVRVFAIKSNGVSELFTMLNLPTIVDEFCDT